METSIAKAYADHVDVRGFDLCSDLIGRVSFTDFMFLLVTGRQPVGAQAPLLDACLVALAEHGLVPSVQASRMTFSSAPEAMQGAVAAGLLGAGSVILGSAELAGGMLTKVVGKEPSLGLEQAAVQVVTQIRESKSPLPGFGHPLHRVEDPRATRLLQLADELGTAGRHVAAVRAVQRAVPQVYGKHLALNVSGAIPAVLLDVDFPLDAMKGIPLVGRTASLVAHLVEELHNPIGFGLAQEADDATDYTRITEPRGANA